jgi:hypothetical protein
MDHLRLSLARRVTSRDSKHGLVLVLITWVLVLTSCVMTLPLPEAEKPASKALQAETVTAATQAIPNPTASPGSLPEPVQEETRRLLQEAAEAFSKDHLTTPVDDNAWYRYLRVLVLDPGNQAATDGINDIVEKYLDWALQDVEAGYLHKTREYLARVRVIDDTHPNLAAVEKRLAEAESIHRQTVELPRLALDNQSAILASELHQLGAQIQEQNARVIIVARNDAEGRWIYQQLNSPEQGPRIRAQVRLDTAPMLRIFTYSD